MYPGVQQIKNAFSLILKGLARFYCQTQDFITKKNKKSIYNFLTNSFVCSVTIDARLLYIVKKQY